MNENLSSRLEKAFYVKSKISHYPLSHSILTVPDGMSVVIFENKDDIDEYFQLCEITDIDNYEILRVKSIYDLMREVADIGYAGLWFFKIQPLLFGNYISDIDIELPSFLYTNNNQFIGATGEIDKPQGFLPWRNFFKTDKIIRRFTALPNDVPYDFSDELYALVVKDISERYKKYHNRSQDDLGDFEIDLDGIEESETQHEPVESIAEIDEPVVKSYDTIKYWRFYDALPLQDPYGPEPDAYCLFTDYAYAQRYLSINRWLENRVTVEKVELNQFIHDLGYWGVFMSVGINPGNERYRQGYLIKRNDDLFVKTVHGLFGINEFNKLEMLDETKLDPIQDTIDQPKDCYYYCEPTAVLHYCH